MLLPTSSQKNRKEKQLLKYFSSLNGEDKNSLIAFAEFLVKREAEGSLVTNNSIPISSPLQIDRPESESVIKAIKRLTKTYPMVEKEQFLHVISDLMTAHMMQGKDSSSVIDELEVLFLNAYEKLE